jgi:NAD(P)-dependent dehydrogenase (short-subunit alcohol dehydrogenase family)
MPEHHELPDGTPAHLPLANTTALVTGAGRGIGRAIALALADAGAAVAVIARSRHEIDETAEMIADRGVAALGLTADVSDATSVRSAVAEIVRNLGEVDLLVNNAGSNRVVGPLWEIDADMWWQDFTTNLRGPFICSREVLPGMIAHRSGRIINITASAAGRTFPYNTAYACSKAALVRLTDCLAAETRDYNVGVFALDPGQVKTQLTDELVGSEAGRRWMGNHLGRLAFGSADEAAQAVVLLARGVGDALSGRWIKASDDIKDLNFRSHEIGARDLYQLRATRPTSI